MTRSGTCAPGEALVFGEPDLRHRRRPGHGARYIALDWKEGSQDVLAELGADGRFVDDGYGGRQRPRRRARPVELTFPNGRAGDVTVKGIFDPPAGGSPFGS